MEYHQQNRRYHHQCQKFRSGMLVIPTINEVASINRQQSANKESHLDIPHKSSVLNKKKIANCLLNSLKTYTGDSKTNKSFAHQKSNTVNVNAIWPVNKQHIKFNSGLFFVLLSSSLLVTLLGQISVDCEPQRFQANRPARQIDCQKFVFAPGCRGISAKRSSREDQPKTLMDMVEALPSSSSRSFNPRVSSSYHQVFIPPDALSGEFQEPQFYPRPLFRFPSTWNQV